MYISMLILTLGSASYLVVRASGPSKQSLSPCSKDPSPVTFVSYILSYIEALYSKLRSGGLQVQRRWKDGAIRASRNWSSVSLSHQTNFLASLPD